VSSLTGTCGIYAWAFMLHCVIAHKAIKWWFDAISSPLAAFRCRDGRRQIVALAADGTSQGEAYIGSWVNSVSVRGPFRSVRCPCISAAFFDLPAIAARSENISMIRPGSLSTLMARAGPRCRVALGSVRTSQAIKDKLTCWHLRTSFVIEPAELWRTSLSCTDGIERALFRLRRVRRLRLR
jgi:hypothetical protein